MKTSSLLPHRAGVAYFPLEDLNPVSDIWYYADRNGHVGPLTLQQLRQTLATVPNAADVLVWRDKFPVWKRAGDVPELRGQFAVPSRSQTHNVGPEARGESLSTPPLKWSWIIAPLLFLGTASNRVGREQMGRLSAEQRISSEVARWFKEEAPDAIGSAVRVIRAKFVGVLIAAVCIAYGLYDGLLQDSPFSGMIVGILSAGILILLGTVVGKYRVKKPTPPLIRVGNICFWLGCALASYGLGVIIYHTVHLGLLSGVRAAVNLLPSVVFYLTLGWGIRYMLGR
jgi:hypothetical protein